MPFQKEEPKEEVKQDQKPVEKPVDGNEGKPEGDVFAFLSDPEFQKQLSQQQSDVDKFSTAAFALSDIVGEDKLDEAMLQELHTKMVEAGMLKEAVGEGEAPAPGQEGGEAPPAEGEQSEETDERSPIGQTETRSPESIESGSEEEPLEDKEFAQSDAAPEETQDDEGLNQDVAPGEEMESPEQDQMPDYNAQADQRVEKVIQRALRVIEALLRDEE